MKMVFGDRLKELREKKGLSQTELSEKIGISKSSIGMYETGKRIPRADKTFVKISDFFNVSIDYLLGLQEPINNNFEKYGLKPIVKKKVPMLGNIACGEPIIANQEYETYIEVDSNINVDFALKAQGDSMINAHIENGDIILIKSQDYIENGQIAAVLIEDEVTLKRFYLQNDTISLVAENPSYPPLIYNKSDAVNIKVLGKAIVIQKLIK